MKIWVCIYCGVLLAFRGAQDRGDSPIGIRPDVASVIARGGFLNQ